MSKSGFWKKKTKHFEQLQRVSADYTNYQKRAARQIADSVAYDKKAILRSLLPSLDNFEHAFAKISSAEGEQTLQKTIEGIHMIYNHMLDTLRSLGVEKVDALGKPFNPDLHEAMMKREEADKENNTVLEVYQPGYTLGGQVLRPAKVIVNRLDAERSKPFPEMKSKRKRRTPFAEFRRQQRMPDLCLRMITCVKVADIHWNCFRESLSRRKNARDAAN